MVPARTPNSAYQPDLHTDVESFPDPVRGIDGQLKVSATDPEGNEVLCAAQAVPPARATWPTEPFINSLSLKTNANGIK